MTLHVRLAPISTGYLHVGNVRIALVNWLYARARAGRVLLRLNDTDEERCKPRFAAAIEGDFNWLGLDWDESARQSERMDRYRAAFERFKGSGRIYPCYETPEELEVKRRSPRVRGRPPVYDRAALALGAAERASLEAAGRRPHWRFLLKGGEIAFDDMVRGAVRFAAESLSDPVLFRADGRSLYVLRSVVDDLDLGVTHVIRGEDYLSTTAVQLQLAAALGAEPEALSFAHLPLLTDVGGHGLSKRLASLELRKLRADGIEPMAVASLLARLGTSEPIEAFARLDALARDFGLGKFSRAAPRFDTRELARLNAKLLHAMPFAQVVARLREIGLKGADERFWKAVRPNLSRLADAETWWRVCAGKITPAIEDPGFAAKALELLPPEPWDDATWKAWTAASAKATGRKGRALSVPLRLALTGLDRGPELKDLLPLVGRGCAAARLKGIRA